MDSTGQNARITTLGGLEAAARAVRTGDSVDSVVELLGPPDTVSTWYGVRKTQSDVGSGTAVEFHYQYWLRTDPPTLGDLVIGFKKDKGEVNVVNFRQPSR